MKLIAAQRGRYKEDSIEQCLEIQWGGYANTITTVEKDNYVLIQNEILQNKASDKRRLDPM